MTYEYGCRCCGHEFEVEQRIVDEPVATCPKCLVVTSNRLISGGTSFLLKGDGWGKDLYSKKEK